MGVPKIHTKHKMTNLTADIINAPIRIALVGCGRISQNHIKAIAVHKDRAQLVALCDSQPERLRTGEQIWQSAQEKDNEQKNTIALFSDYSELLLSAREGITPIDLVVLTTPSGMHPSQTIAAAEAGLHVCTEKPMATCWEDGLKMVEACDKAKVKLFVVKQNRFNSTLKLVKKQIEAGRFGQMAMVSINVFWQRPQSYYDQDNWRGTRKMDGGALMNQASHYIDLLDWLVGPVESLSASIATLGRSIESEDTAAIQLRWKNGSLGTMAVTMLTYPKNLEGSITLLGENGTVKIGGPAVNQIEHWMFADENADDELVEKASYETTSVYGFGHPPYYANMLDALQGLDEAQCDGQQGLHSLELLTGAYRSASDGTTVCFPLKRLTTTE